MVCNLRLVAIMFALAVGASCALAQEFTADAHTLLLLHGNGSLVGAGGETPTFAAGHGYTLGIFGQGIDLPAGAQLRYAAAGNLQAAAGTVEFWLRPHWQGNDGQGHLALSWGTWGGLLVGKDGGNYWRIILNRYGDHGLPERGAGTNVSDQFVAGLWHHCAFTWDDDALQVYVDGELKAEAAVGFAPPAITAGEFQISGEGTAEYLDAVIDELRISDIVRTSTEIEDAYLRGLQITAVTIAPDPLELLETWVVTPTVTATTSEGTREIPAASLAWQVAEPTVASVDAQGRVLGLAAGTTTLTGSYEGHTDTVTLVVTAPVLPPQFDDLPPDLATPAADYLYLMPVVIIRYFPTVDGVHVDPEIAGYIGPLTLARDETELKSRRVKFMLEEGSRFRGFVDATARPSLGYQVIDMITVYEELPRGKDVGEGHYYPDYNQILERFDAEHYVNDLGVKEFWLWGYHYGEIVPAESNMASPTTGDISNSFRFADDLPVYDHTYVLYNYNFARTQAEAVHNHGHQLEAILEFANVRQAGNAELFWRRFVGQDENGGFVTGRCGWTHMPPNTNVDYDYENPTSVASDIADWRPEGGATALVDADTWGALDYAWPDEQTWVPQRVESQWYVYWMQSLPGFGNTITYDGETLTNWWHLTARWDEAAAAGLGLWGASVAVPDDETAPGAPVVLTSRPNPFNPRTVLTFTLAAPGDVDLSVYDLAGRCVARLVDDRRPAGRHDVVWDGCDDRGNTVASGVYVAKLTTAAASRSTRLVLVR